MPTILERIQDLPPDLQDEVLDFAEFLAARRSLKPTGQLRLDWRGALQHLREEQTSVDLQHEALRMREDCD